VGFDGRREKLANFLKYLFDNNFVSRAYKLFVRVGPEGAVKESPKII
jgi:hypothetical protein